MHVYHILTICARITLAETFFYYPSVVVALVDFATVFSTHASVENVKKELF